MQTAEALYTLQDLARRRGVPYYVVRYAIDVAAINPLRRIGNVRIWGEHQLSAIDAAINRTAKPREAQVCA